MADAITEDQEAVLRSWVGQNAGIAALQDSYDRHENFDDVVLETLRAQIAIMVSDQTSVFTVDGLTLNKTENIRQLRLTIKEFQNSGGTGLDSGNGAGSANFGPRIVEISRKEIR